MLTNLDIRNTSISDLLSTMRRNPWVNLRELLLGSNKQFFALPDFLFLSQEEGGKLSKLECGDCNLKSLPHNLGHLGASLLHLDLKKNQLSSFAIPPSISLLINLATLNLRYAALAIFGYTFYFLVIITSKLFQMNYLSLQT